MGLGPAPGGLAEGRGDSGAGLGRAARASRRSAVCGAGSPPDPRRRKPGERRQARRNRSRRPARATQARVEFVREAKTLQMRIADDGRGGVLFGEAADFADHEHGKRLGIFLEELQRVDEVGAVDRVTANTDKGRLPQTCGCCLQYGLIGQCAGTGHNADFTAFMDVARHNADFAFIRRDNAGAVWPDETGLFPSI